MAAPLQPPDVPRFAPGFPIGPGPAQFNALIRDPFTYLLDPPRFVAKRTAAQTVPEDVSTPVAWDTITEDPYDGWDAGAPSAYVVQAPGWYCVTGAVSVAGTGAAGLVVIPVLAVAGESQIGAGADGWEGPEVFVPTGAASQPKIVSATWTVYANLGDPIELLLYYSAESAIVATDATPGIECRIELVWDGV